MLMDQKTEYRRLRAPREHGQAVVDPPLAQTAGLVQSNIETLRACDYDFGGRTLEDLMTSGRRELLARARQYTLAYRDVDLAGHGAELDSGGAGPARVLLAGHQPSLFHAGVWFKNFVLDKLARKLVAVPINLVIDSDTIKSTSIRVPSGPISQPHVETIPFDRPGDEIPYEERPVLDRDLFTSFAVRVEEALEGLVRHPLIESLWPLAERRMHGGAMLGECLAQARHQLEGSWGLATLELPQSQVCQLEAFRWFVAHLLAQLPRLWEIHNAALAEYRAVHRLRSKTHPVPDLALEDGWLESPLWIWTQDNPTRRRVFVRQRGEQILLSDRAELEIPLELTGDGPLGSAVEALGELEAAGIKLRTRALVTTMFARLVLGDLFLHGIGGAKYDQVTDQIVQRFFGVSPTGFLTVSATLKLPIERPVHAGEDAAGIARLLRDLRYHPERHVDCDGKDTARCRQIHELVESKRRWIETPKTPENARCRHEEIERANLALLSRFDEQRQQLVAKRDRLAAEARREAVWGSREYAFCLQPGNELRKMILELLAVTS